MPRPAETRSRTAASPEPGPIRPRAAPAVRSPGLVGRDDLVWRLRVLVTEARGPVWLTGPSGSGSTAVATAVAAGLARGMRVLGFACTPGTTFVRLVDTLAEAIDDTPNSARTAIVVTDAGAVAEPGFARALAHLAGAVPHGGWLIAGTSRAADGRAGVAIPLLPEADVAAAVDAAAARAGSAISRTARGAAASLARGLPGLAGRLVAEAGAAARAAGADGIGLPHLRAAARTLARPEAAAAAPPLRRAAARVPFGPDGSFARTDVTIALARAGEAGAPAPERDEALVPAGRGRLRFSDDAAAADLLLSEFGWTYRP